MLAQVDATRAQLGALDAQLAALRSSVELYFEPLVAPASATCPPHPDSDLIAAPAMGFPNRRQCRRCREVIDA